MAAQSHSSHSNPHHHHHSGSGGPVKPTSIYFPFCSEISKYEKQARVGQGTFGEVFKARNRKTNQIVALKKVRMENEKEGFPMTALREIRILQLLNHENIVHFIEICRTKTTPYSREGVSIFIVSEFCEHDLAGLLSCREVKFSLPAIKSVMQQLFNALFYIHGCRILHRDMKSSNILITKGGVLKLCDFGLARALTKSGQQQRYTNRVVTLWYRAPELLLGERNYGPAIDMWGAGCVMGEMWTRAPIMQGDSEQHQISLISQLCGSITPDVWEGVEQLEQYNKLDLPKSQKRKIRERLRHYVKDNNSVDLIDKLLVLDPKKRVDSDACLNHDIFWDDPMPQQQELVRTLTQVKTSKFVMNNYLHHPVHAGGGAPRPGGGAGVGGNVQERIF